MVFLELYILVLGAFRETGAREEGRKDRDLEGGVGEGDGVT